MLLVAVTGWVTGFWWCSGRWEQTLWFSWILVPVLLWNVRPLLALWMEWAEGWRSWWFLFWAVVEWQFWVTGFRGESWWSAPGAGKDALMMMGLVSGLVLAGRHAEARYWLWRMVLVAATMAVLLSLIFFYSRIPLDGERFRLCWRGWPGFNAVTTGLLAGLGLMAGLDGRHRERSIKSLLHWAALVVLGFGLAASESRGALLATAAGSAWWLLSHHREWRRLAWPLFGFSAYWFLVAFAPEESSGLVERGSSGRLEIYAAYLSGMSGWDWLIGQGQVRQLPEEVLGWHVHHPHNAYLGQLSGYGLIGLGLLLATLGSGFLRMRHTREASLLVFGLVATLFDGGMSFSLLAIARWEVLVVLVPLVLGVVAREPSIGRAEPEDSDRGRDLELR